MLFATSSLTEVGQVPNAQVLTNTYSRLGIDPNANEVLVQFQDREDSWQYVPPLLEELQDENVKFLVWQIAENFIKKRWNSIDEATKSSFRDFVFLQFEHSLKIPPDNNICKKIQSCTVWIMTEEFPEINPGFIQDIINLASPGLPMENVVQTLEFFMDTVFGENAEDRVSYLKINSIQNGITENGEVIFELIKHIFATSLNKITLMKSTLKLLRYFIRFIPPQLTVENNIFQTIITHCLHNSHLIGEAMIFIHEVYESQQLSEELVGQAQEIFHILIETLAQTIPDDADFDTLYANDDFKVKSFAFCLSTFLIKYQEQIEIPELAEHIRKAITWMFHLTVINDYMVQKICYDFWFSITRRTWTEKTSPSGAVEEVYLPIFPDLRRLIIPRMWQPEEFLIEIRDGEVVRQKSIDAQVFDLFKSQKSVLVMLTNIDNEDTVNTFGEFFTALQQDFQRDLFSSLCYAAGAISGTLGAEPEKEFMTQVSQVLLEINAQCESDIEARAFVSGGLMYVFSQYPRFVASSYQFFKQIIEKLFEFMHSQIDPVREMAVNSFGMISSKTSIQFHYTSSEQPVPFITEIIQNFETIISDLQQDAWVVQFVGYLAKVINSQKNPVPKKEQITLLMEKANERWNNLLSSFSPDDLDYDRSLLFVLQFNEAVVSNTRGIFNEQLSLIFSQMIEVFQRFCSILNDYISHIEYDPDTDERVGIYKEIKSTIINILKEYIQKTPNVRANASNLIHPVMNNIITDFDQSGPYSRVPQVIELVNAMSQHMKEDVSGIIPEIFRSVFGPTVEMVKEDFDSFYDFRLPFYSFLHTIIKNHINIMLTAPPEDFSFFVESINWGVRHPYHDICIEAIAATKDLINSTKRDPSFSRHYVMTIVNHTLDVLTDTLHKSAFREQSDLLMMIFNAQSSVIQIGQMVDSLMESFPNADPEEFASYLSDMFQYARSNSVAEFHQTLRALLISTKHFSARDQQIDIESQEAQESQFNQDMDGVEGLEGPAEPIQQVFIDE